MAYLAILIGILVIIGAFMIHPLLGWIVLLCVIFSLAGGWDNVK